MSSLERRPGAYVFKRDWTLHRKGPQDEQRHDEKAKEAILNNLPYILSNINITSDDPSSTVNIPIPSLEIPHIRFKDSNEGMGTGEGEVGDLIDGYPVPGDQTGDKAGKEPGQELYEQMTLEEFEKIIFEYYNLPNLKPKKTELVETEEYVFEDVIKKKTTTNLDLERTIYANILRNAIEHGKAEIGGIIPEDLRVRTVEQEIREQTNALVIIMGDVSGSMNKDKKALMKGISWWIRRFLQYKYPNVEKVYIAHHTEAWETTEEKFFKLSESGGTTCSSAIKEAKKIIQDRYPMDLYNIYPIHFSDGDNDSYDNPNYIKDVNEMLDLGINQFAFIQLISNHSFTLLTSLQKSIKDPRFAGVYVGGKDDVSKAIEIIFPPEKEVSSQA